MFVFCSLQIHIIIISFIVTASSVLLEAGKCSADS